MSEEPSTDRPIVSEVYAAERLWFDNTRLIVKTTIGLWLVFFLVGTFALYTPGALRSGYSMSFDRTLFTSANVATLSGFAQSNARMDDFTLPIRVLFFVQMLVALFLKLVGGGWLLCRVLLRPYGDRQVLAAGLVLIVSAGLAGLTLLSQSKSALDAITSGLGLLGGVAHNPPTPTRQALSLVVLQIPVSLIGGLGIVILLDVRARLVGRAAHLTRHVVAVLRIVAAGYISFLLLTFIVLRIIGGSTIDAVLDANGVVFSCLTLGGLHADLQRLPIFMNYVLVGLMLIGVGSAGTTGGIGLAWLLTMPRASLRVIRRAIVAQFVVVLFIIMVLFISEPQLPTYRLLVNAMSAVFNLGLSHDAVSVTGPGLYLLSLLMVGGFLTVPLVLLHMTKPTTSGITHPAVTTNCG